MKTEELPLEAEADDSPRSEPGDIGAAAPADGRGRVAAAAPEVSAPVSMISSGRGPDRLKFLQTITGILAPTTVLTALLFYFGWLHTHSFFATFGLDTSLLGLTTQEYVLRSVDVLFVPLTMLSLAVLGAWAFSRLTQFLAAHWSTHLNAASSAVAIVGAILALVGLTPVAAADRLIDPYSLVYPVCLGTAGLLFLQAARVRRFAHPADQTNFTSNYLLDTGCLLLIVLSTFWAVTNYAPLVGTSRAQAFQSEPHPSTIVFSKQDLNIGAPGVLEVACAESSAYPFRYEGFRLLLRSGGQYFLLPENWSPTEGHAIVLPADDSVRLEFAPPGDRAPGGLQGQPAC